MDRRPTLSLNEWAVLGVLVERARHGYDVAAELAPGAPLGSIWTLRRPLVYRAVDRLHDLGLVEPHRQEAGAGGPPRTVYGVTRAGRARLRAWLDEPVANLRDVRSALLLKLALHQRLGSDRARLVANQRAALHDRFDALQSPPTDPDDLARLWRHHSAAAVAAFLDSL